MPIVHSSNKKKNNCFIRAVFDLWFTIQKNFHGSFGCGNAKSIYVSKY